MLRMKIGASHDFTHDLSSSVKSARLHVSLAINTSTPRDKRIIGELPYLLLWPALRSCTFAAPSTRNPQIQICENDKGDFPAIINYTGRVLLPLLWKPSDILLINWYSYCIYNRLTFRRAWFELLLYGLLTEALVSCIAGHWIGPHLTCLNRHKRLGRLIRGE